MPEASEFNFESNPIPVRSTRLLKLTWRIIGECRVGCSDCYDYQNMGDNKISQKQEDAVIDDIECLVDRGTRVFVHITGGEPLAHQRVVPITEKLVGKGVLATIITSGCTGRESKDDQYLTNLQKLTNLRSDKLTPILSSKVTLPRYQERFGFSVPMLAKINGFVGVRHTIYEENESDWEEFVKGEGYQEIDRSEITRPMPSAFYRDDLVIHNGNESRYFIGRDDDVLKVFSHNVFHSGLAVNSQNTVRDDEECVYLQQRKRQIPYLDIWPSGQIYPCFVLGKEIPDLSVGMLGETSLKEALQNAAVSMEKRRHRFEIGVAGECCDRCRNPGSDQQ